MSREIASVMLVWLVLMLSTAASTWWLSLPVVAPRISTMAVMLIAAIKVGLVMAYFMELRQAPRAWQLAGSIWVLVTASTVMAFYWM